MYDVLKRTVFSGGGISGIPLHQTLEEDGRSLYRFTIVRGLPANNSNTRPNRFKSHSFATRNTLSQSQVRISSTLPARYTAPWNVAISLMIDTDDLVRSNALHILDRLIDLVPKTISDEIMGKLEEVIYREGNEDSWDSGYARKIIEKLRQRLERKNAK